jgi:methyl-accepting chemotaxis protein
VATPGRFTPSRWSLRMKKYQYSSLSIQVSLCSILVIFIAMCVYSTVMYFVRGSRMEIVHELGNNLAMVFVLGCLIHLALHYTLRRLLMRPLEQLYVKMYAVTRGDFAPVALETDIQELQDIANGINMMAQRLQKLPGEQGLGHMQLDVTRLRHVADDEAHAMPEETRDYLRDLAGRIEAKLYPG